MSGFAIENPEDSKLVTLARGAKSRVQAVEGAAVRDDTGRTYSSADIALPSLTLSALSLATAQAVASGARGIEAAVVISETLDDRDAAVIREAGGVGAVVWCCTPDGTPIQRIHL